MKTNLRRKLLSIVLCGMMLAGVFAPITAAADTATPSYTLSDTVDVDYDILPDSDELLAGYLEKQIYGGISLYGTTAGDRLEGIEKNVYNELKLKLEKVARGDIESTIFNIESDISSLSWTKEQLGVSAIIADGKFTAEAISAASEKFNGVFDTSKLLNCLLADCPYELYWFDKTNKGAMQLKYGLSGDSSRISIGSLTFYFMVSSAYKGEYEYTVNTTKTSAASTAANNAKAIVDKYADKTDWEKLNAYRTEICRLVSYNRLAADGGVSYGDPWQLIYVFDGDSNTNVVCEGYAKAFQYLCDLSDFSENVVCNTVTGMMDGGTGAGPHMWNVVEYGDEYYLVDITNCDDGSIGANTELFMVGTAAKDGDITYTFTVGSSQIVYVYDEDQSDLICDGYPALFNEEWNESRSYKYIGSSLNKEFDGKPVKIRLSDILATDNRLTDAPLSEAGLYGKYCLADWYEQGNGGTMITGIENDGAIVGPSASGNYRFVLRSAFPCDETREFITIDFTISAGEPHTHSFGAWVKLDDNEHKRICECGEYETSVHNWDEGKITKPATHLELGRKTYTCKLCNAEKYEDIPKTTAHTIGDWEKISDSQYKRACACGEEEESFVKENGVWYNKINGKVNSNAATLLSYRDKWYYFEKGKIDFSITTLCFYNNKWYYVEKGIVKDTTTLCFYNNKWYYVERGIVKDTTTLCFYNNKWYYVERGVVKDTTTLCFYNNKWYYVERGVVKDTTTLCLYNGTWFYVERGVVKDTTTLCLYNGTWFYIERGRINWNAKTLCNYNGSWFYVENGKVNWNATTLCLYNGTWFYVEKGVVKSTTTLCLYNGTWFYVENGRVNWNATTLCLYNGTWFYVEKGVVKSKTTLCLYNGTWFYVENGRVNWNATTLCKYGNNWFYVKNGRVDWNANTRCFYNGRWYNVRNGVVK